MFVIITDWYLLKITFITVIDDSYVSIVSILPISCTVQHTNYWFNVIYSFTSLF